MMTMHDMTRLFGVTTEDLSNWTRRGLVDLPGRRGTIREFSAVDRRECLVATFAKALSWRFDISEAFAVARNWAIAESEGKLARFWAANDRTGSGVEFENEAVIEYGLMAGALEDETPGGFADVRPIRDTRLPATAMTIIDRGEIVRRLDAALSVTESGS